MTNSPLEEKNRFRGKKEIEKIELDQNKKLKPHLQKFLIRQQRDRAEIVHKEKTAEEKQLLKQAQVIDRAGKLACVAFFEQKLWQQVPPYFQMNWLYKTPTTEAEINEMNGDVSGFATYLVREYNNWYKYKDIGKGYPNPMQEEQLLFFWVKFNNDLRLLIEAERRRVAAGNKPTIIDPTTSSSPRIYES